MLLIDFLCRTGSKLHQAAAKLGSGCLPVLAFQRRQHRLLVFLPQFPNPRGFRPAHRAGICNIKDIFQMGPPVSILAEQGNPFGTGPDPPAHFIIPQLHFRAGRRVGTLGKNEELFVKGVFIEPGSGG